MPENVNSQAVMAGHPAGQTALPALRPTPLAALLARSAAQPELAAYRGMLTPLKLDAPERETAALLVGAAIHDLGWLHRVAVRGNDRFRWLSGMVTNTVNDLGSNAGAWNLVLNAQGRIQGDLHVWREGDALELEIAADQIDRLLAHLNHFIIMDDVELIPLSLDSAGDLTGVTALGVAGPQAASLLRRLGLPEPNEPLSSVRAAWNGIEMLVVRAYGVVTPHFELWSQAAQIPSLWQALADAGATAVGAATLDALRVAEGIPAYGVDMVERDLPQETSQMRALHFNKGCYLGQEIVERIRSRGSVHRHLRPLELFGPIPAHAAELTTESGAPAGQITSTAELLLTAGRRFFALGMIRGEAELGNQSFNYNAGDSTGTARILAAPPQFEASEQVMQSAEPIGN